MHFIENPQFQRGICTDASRIPFIHEIRVRNHNHQTPRQPIGSIDELPEQFVTVEYRGLSVVNAIVLWVLREVKLRDVELRRPPRRAL